MSPGRTNRPLALALVLAARVAHATEPTGCRDTIARENLIPCALAASLPVRAQLEQLAATEARRRTARLWFPSAATFSVTAAARFTPPSEQSQTFANWYLTLQQEVEIGGERGARLRAADAGITAQARRVVVTRRDVAANAWMTWFDVLAFDEEAQLLRKSEALLVRVAAAARTTADRGLLAPIDADTADAQALRATQARAGIERRLQAARAALATQLGQPPDGATLVVAGELAPLGFAAALDRVDVEAQPEVQALMADQRGWREQASLFRRLRAPNLTLSLSGENDGPNEKVIGAGIALPIVLPEPLGRLYSGDIAEAEALARRAALEAEQERRRLRAEVVRARQAYRSLVDEVARYTPERLQRAQRSLESIADQIAAGRLAVRDALLAQQSLLELLLAAVEARHALCLASIDLARAAGVALEQNPR